MIYARTCVFTLILIICLILAFLAKMEKRQRGQNLERKQELEIIFATALSKAVISTVLMLTVAGRFRLPPPIGVLILALTTYLPINLFSPLNKTSQRPPLR